MEERRERYINPYTDFGFKKDYWDYYSTMKTATKKGHAEGLAEGLEKGMEEGLAKGREEERKKAEAERRESARKLRDSGVPVALIASSLGLSEQQISEL